MCAAPIAKGSERAADLYTARLTVDITPALRRPIKTPAVKRGVTVAATLREVLTRQFSKSAGGPS